MMWWLYWVFIVGALGVRCMSPSRDHLVVLCHGLGGSKTDLSYLRRKLEGKGFTVLSSEVNERLRSMDSIVHASSRLKEEIEQYRAHLSTLRHISFVGNSLGGIYARHVIASILDDTNSTMLGLEPRLFVTIATPHLGVRWHTMADDWGIRLPVFAKRIVAISLGQAVRELFGCDGESMQTKRSPLLYEMATMSHYLRPLQAFRRRRAYANLQHDALVPLGTAAFLSHEEVITLRKRHKDAFGIVEVASSSITTNAGHCDVDGNRRAPSHQRQENDEPVDQQAMRVSLNTLPWEKVYVHFPSWLPTAHNTICAMTKTWPWLDRLLGYEQGQAVIDHLVDWMEVH